MTEYLYGAAVQGIQGFIYQTNKLKEIVGASELVERICTDLFASVLYSGSPEANEYDLEKRRMRLLKRLEEDPNAILNAAGNIKYIFRSEEECRRVVRIFPKSVMQFAPGITISQSVVRIGNGIKFGEGVKSLERNLRTQRNIQMRDLSMGLMGILRSRDTGLPVSHIKPRKEKSDTVYLDSATYHKLFDENDKRKPTFKILCEKAFGPNVDLHDKNLPHDIKNMTGSNDWIAIIHADGNGLGQIVQKIGTDKDLFREFSRNLDAATTAASVKAFEEEVKPKIPESGMIPMRPIVLSGDDLTVICRADLAIPFTKAFLKYFELETKEKLGALLRDKEVFKDGAEKLTACAGIAFIKSSFPFHFGYRLAETLCDRAKKDTKAIFKATEGNLPGSCLMFHKVQDSFVADFNDIAERELTPRKEISFEFGPYYLDAGVNGPDVNRWTIENLWDKVQKLSEKEYNPVKTGLRNWLTLLHDNEEMAIQKLKRMKDVATPKKIEEFIDSVTCGTGVRMKKMKDPEGNCIDITVYPVYDILALHTIKNQTTKI